MTGGPGGAAAGGLRTDHSGIALILGCYAMLVTMDAIVKYLAEAGYPVLQIAWARFFFHFIVALPILLFFYRSRLRSSRPKFQLSRSLLQFLTTVVFFIALKLVSLAEATVIAFAAPLFLIGLSVLVLHEKVGLRRWVGVAAGFAGILIIIRPGPGMNLAYLVPLAAALMYATYELTTRMMATDDHALTTFFYTPIVGVVFGSAILPFVWISPTVEAWALMILCGLLGAGGTLLMIKAFERSEASLLAPFGYSSIIWATLLGWAIFGRWPDGWTFGGAALIIVSGLYIWHRERKLHKAALKTPVVMS